MPGAPPGAPGLAPNPGRAPKGGRAPPGVNPGRAPGAPPGPAGKVRVGCIGRRAPAGRNPGRDPGAPGITRGPRSARTLRPRPLEDGTSTRRCASHWRWSRVNRPRTRLRHDHAARRGRRHLRRQPSARTSSPTPHPQTQIPTRLRQSWPQAQRSLPAAKGHPWTPQGSSPRPQASPGPKPVREEPPKQAQSPLGCTGGGAGDVAGDVGAGAGAGLATISGAETVCGRSPGARAPGGRGALGAAAACGGNVGVPGITIGGRPITGPTGGLLAIAGVGGGATIFAPWRGSGITLRGPGAVAGTVVPLPCLGPLRSLRRSRSLRRRAGNPGRPCSRT